MKIKYLCPFWGSSHLSAKEFVIKALVAGYQGIEMNVPDNKTFVVELTKVLEETKCVFVAQQWLPPRIENESDYSVRMADNLMQLAELNPHFINSHTGKDFFSFDDNCRIIEECSRISEKTGVKIVHETHRGRFNFHAASTLPYLQRFPGLKLNADFSHWTNVSESLLEDQEHILEKIFPRCAYIHARIGHDQSTQANHPFAPEWKNHLDRYVGWWQKILDLAKQRGEKVFYICPEFGPYPYIQQLPFTKKETADQWQVNLEMMEYLREKLL